MLNPLPMRAKVAELCRKWQVVGLGSRPFGSAVRDDFAPTATLTCW